MIDINEIRKITKAKQIEKASAKNSALLVIAKKKIEDAANDGKSSVFLQKDVECNDYVVASLTYNGFMVDLTQKSVCTGQGIFEHNSLISGWKVSW